MTYDRTIDYEKRIIGAMLVDPSVVPLVMEHRRTSATLQWGAMLSMIEGVYERCGTVDVVLLNHEIVNNGSLYTLDDVVDCANAVITARTVLDDIDALGWPRRCQGATP